MKNLISLLERKRDIGNFLLRFFVGGRLAFGAFDIVISWSSLIEFSEFLSTFNFPFPILSACLSAYAQFVCGILILIGYKLRYAALIMVFNFIIAVVFVHLMRGDGIEKMTVVLSLLFGSATLSFIGSGKLSVEKS